MVPPDSSTEKTRKSCCKKVILYCCQSKLGKERCLSVHVESKVRSCSVCQENRAHPSKAQWPHKPWARLHIDHAGPFLGHTFLITLDAHAKWIEAHMVNSTSAEATIKKLTEIFTTHGVPEQIVSDNGTGFSSQKFAAFTKVNGIHHTFVSPYHPSSNGQAEHAVQTFKHTVSKIDGLLDSQIACCLFHYRLTPQTSTGISPAELLMGRRLHCKLTLLHPNTAKHIANRQERMTTPRQPLCTFKEKDRLYAKSFRGPNKWIPVTVVARTGPVSYQVKLSDRQIIRRHLDHLRYRYPTEEKETWSQDKIDEWPLPNPDLTQN